MIILHCKISNKAKVHFLNLIDKYLKVIQTFINMKFKINQFKKVHLFRE